MNIKLIVSDVDGTILPRGGAISDRTKAAVASCQRAGAPFVIASGRWFVSAKVIADALEQTKGYMIISGGGAVVDLEGTILQEWTLTREQARRIYEILRTQDVMINTFVRNAVYRVNTQALKHPVKGLGGYLGDAYHMVNDDWAQFEEKGLDHPYKMEAYSDDPEKLAVLQKAVVEAGFSVSSSYMTNIEVMAPGCGKGTAVAWLADRLGVRTEDCMAFGDNTNDLSMLSAVGWPVAVDNAVDELKAAARIVAPDSAQDGVAQVIERALRGELA